MIKHADYTHSSPLSNAGYSSHLMYDYTLHWYIGFQSYQASCHPSICGSLKRVQHLLLFYLPILLVYWSHHSNVCCIYFTITQISYDKWVLERKVHIKETKTNAYDWNVLSLYLWSSHKSQHCLLTRGSGRSPDSVLCIGTGRIMTDNYKISLDSISR